MRSLTKLQILELRTDFLKRTMKRGYISPLAKHFARQTYTSLLSEIRKLKQRRKK